ncbi:MAG: hypothetical protein H7A23_02850 [Leptospiraceae bacterium]|nr:hypothetical protein [Leptospiraceae bacterium]MCP5493469.1 hypothetical protein [Leptospiraceae bacterium]
MKNEKSPFPNPKLLAMQLGFIYMFIGLVIAFFALMIIGFYDIGLTSLKLTIKFLRDFYLSIGTGLFTLLVLTGLSGRFVGFLQLKKMIDTSFFTAVYALCIFAISCLLGSFVNFLMFYLYLQSEPSKIIYSYFGKPLSWLLSVGSIPSFVIGGIAGYQFSKKMQT